MHDSCSDLTHSLRPISVVFAVLVVALQLAASGAAAAERACDGSILRPEELRGTYDPVPKGLPSTGRPTPVEINLQITELSGIDEVQSRFRFEGYGDFRWCDRRSAFDPVTEGTDVQRHLGVADENPIWSIDLSVSNGVGAVEVTRRLIDIHSDGSIRVSGYFNTMVAAPFDLRRFPFDRQILEIQIESFTYNSEILELVTGNEHVSYEPDLFVPEWRIEGIDARVEQTLNVRDRIPFSRAVISMHLAREWGFYVYKLGIPLFLIVALSWSIFWMTDETLANRMRISATAFLTVVAYQFAISGSLPKVAYLTLMDRLMIASFLLIALSALECMPVIRLRKTDPQAALRLDRTSQWLFPLSYVAAIAIIALTH